MKSVFVFCEGRHDVVFAQRCLGALGGCSWVSEPIKELPSPLGPSDAIPLGLIASWYQHSSIEELDLRRAAHPPSPNVQSIVKRNANDIIFVLIGTNGKDQIEGVMKILMQLQAVFRRAKTGEFDVSQYAAAFLFDADDVGLEETLNFFRRHYSAHFGEMGDLEHGKWIAGNGVPFGCFVFHDGNEPRKTGTLETHVAPMVEAVWPNKFSAAKKYIEDNACDGCGSHMAKIA